MSVNINSEVRQRQTLETPHQVEVITRRLDLEKEKAEAEVVKLEHEMMAAELAKAEQEAQEAKAEQLKREIENVAER